MEAECLRTRAATSGSFGNDLINTPGVSFIGRAANMGSFPRGVLTEPMRLRASGPRGCLSFCYKYSVMTRLIDQLKP